MSLIPLKKWAEQHGISASSARHKISRGKLAAEKIGRDWLIEEDTPNIDHRVKSGEYKGWRQKQTK